MPGLYACNRRWDIGSDDLMWPAFAEIWIRLAWLVVVSIVVDTHKNSFSCSSGNLVQAYYIGMLVILSLHIVFDVIIMILSSRGTITNPLPRRHIPIALYFKISLFLPELLWTILGTYWAFDDSSDCPNIVVLTVKIAALAGWGILLCLVIGLFIVFDPIGHRNFTDDASHTSARKLWETRCRLICCCAGCDEQNADVFKDISRLLSNFFKDLDVVPTDVAAGLILVQQAQSAQSQLFRYERVPIRQSIFTTAETSQTRNTQQNQSTNGTKNDLHGGDQADALIDVSDNTRNGSYHGEEYSTNEYDKPQHTTVRQPSPVTLSNPYGIAVTTSGDNVASTSQSTPCDRVATIDIDIEQRQVGDNMKPLPWMTIHNSVHFMQFALATFTWPVYIYMNIFTGACKLWPDCKCCSCYSNVEYVTHDNCYACHTAAVKKIANVKDTDIVYASFYNKVFEIPFIVLMDHDTRSIVIAVRGTMSLKDTLTDLSADCESCHIEGLGEQYVHRGILTAAKYIETTINNLNLLDRAFQKGPGYRIVITGHSLGAGAATLLSVLLRPRYRDLICFAFSPPGGLLSLPLSRYTEEFVCSIVVGKDIIPRLSMTTLEKLKAQILRQVADCQRPKFRVLAGGCWHACCSRSSDVTDNTHRPLVEEGRPKNYTHEQEGIEEAIHESERACAEIPELYMPGVVLYLEEEEPTTGCFETPAYRPVWARPDHFTDIIVHPKMLTDHFPDAVLKALEQVNERAGEEPRYMLKSL